MNNTSIAGVLGQGEGDDGAEVVGRVGRRADCHGRGREFDVGGVAGAAAGGGHGEVVATAARGVGKAAKGGKGRSLVSDLSSHGHGLVGWVFCV